MGVKDLWTLLLASGRRVSLEQLRGKRLAVGVVFCFLFLIATDASIWLYQFVKAIRAEDGSAGCLKGLYFRLLKLLYYKIRPVFVFDGETPLLKKKTSLARKAQRAKSLVRATKTSRELILHKFIQRSQLEQAQQGSQPNLLLPIPIKQEQHDLELLVDEDEHSIKPQKEEDTPALELMKSVDPIEAIGSEYNRELAKMNIDRALFNGLPTHLQMSLIEDIKFRKQRQNAKILKDQKVEITSSPTDFSSMQLEMLISTGERRKSIREIKQMVNQEQRIASNSTSKIVWRKKSFDTSAVDDDSQGQAQVKTFKVNLDEDDPFFGTETNTPAGWDSMEQQKHKIRSIFDDNGDIVLPDLQDSFPQKKPTQGLPSIEITLPPQTVQIKKEVTDDVRCIDLSAFDDLAWEDGGDAAVTSRPQENVRPLQFDEDNLCWEEGGGDDNEEMDVDADQQIGSVETVTYPIKIEVDDEETAEPEDDEQEIVIETKPIKRVVQTTRVTTTVIETQTHQPVQMEIDDDESTVEPSQDDGEDEIVIETPTTNTKPSPLKEREKPTQTSKEPPLKKHKPENPIETPNKPTPSKATTPPIVIETPLPPKPATKASQAAPAASVQTPEKAKPKTAAPLPLFVIPSLYDIEDGVVDDYVPPENLTRPAPEAIGNIVTDQSSPPKKQWRVSSVEEPKETPVKPIKSKQVNTTVKETPSTKKKTKHMATKQVKDKKAEEPNFGFEGYMSEQSDESSQDGDVVITEADEIQITSEATAHVTMTTSGGLSDSSQGISESLVRDKIEELKLKYQKAKTAATSVTTEIIRDTQSLLTLFGIPFITSPTEADSQCAILENLGLVDGIISNDNDMFLFGGKNVYRDIFSSKKQPSYHSAELIENELGVNRQDLITLAFMLGSDYTPGVEGVGLVLAAELLAEFRPEGTDCCMDTLEALAKWIKTDTDVKKENDDEEEPEEESAFRKKHKNLKTKIELDAQFPDPEVLKGYTEPDVDASTQEFTWGEPQLDEIRLFLAEKLGWDQDRSDQHLLPAMKRYTHNEATNSLGNFVTVQPGSGPPLCDLKSKRLKKAITILKTKSSASQRPKTDM